MGPSGSGKSTLLNILAGLDRPTEGEVTVAGERLNDLSEDELAAFRARHVGFVFQFFNLIPVLTAQENVELPLLLHRPLAGRAPRAGGDGASAGGPRGARGPPPAPALGRRAAAGGDRAGARQRPELILADEPTGNLDAKNAEDTLSLLRMLKQEFGKTVVMVTHDPRAQKFVDDVHHLDKGVLIAPQSGEGRS